MTQSPTARRPLLLLIVLALAAPLLGGCQERQKDAVEAATKALEATIPLVERDTKQVRDGMPPGAKLLAKHLDEDPGGDPEGLRRAIKKARAGTHELAVAKSSFFIFVDPAGMVLRSEADPDLAAGKSLFKAVPSAKKMLEAKDKPHETFGFMHGLRGVEKGDDEQWIVGSQVSSGGKVTGAFVSGWSLRHYANYLEALTRLEMKKHVKDPTKAPPLSYVFVIKGARAYGGPVTPDSNAKIVAEMMIPEKLKDGTFTGETVLEERTFTVIGRPIPALGDDAAAAIMVSAI